MATLTLNNNIVNLVELSCFTKLISVQRAARYLNNIYVARSYHDISAVITMNLIWHLSSLQFEDSGNIFEPFGGTDKTPRVQLSGRNTVSAADRTTLKTRH